MLAAGQSLSRPNPFDDLSTEVIEIILICACSDPDEPVIYLPKSLPSHGSKPIDVIADATDPWILSLVCTRWRDIVVGYSPLWSNIDIMAVQDDDQLDWETWGFSQLRDTLTNSGTHPLQITLGSDKNHDTRIISDILDILICHSERWQKITLKIPWRQPRHWTIDSLNGRLPLLKQLRIEEMGHSKSLERLVCPSLEILEISAGHGPAIAKFLDISSCSLTHLHLGSRIQDNGFYYDISPIVQHPSLVNLRSLSLTSQCDLDSPVFHSHTTLPFLDTFTYYNDDFWEYGGFGDELIDELVESIQNFVRSRTQELHQVTLTNAAWDGPKTVLKNCFFTFHFGCNEDFCGDRLGYLLEPLRYFCLERNVNVRLELKFDDDPEIEEKWKEIHGSIF